MDVVRALRLSGAGAGERSSAAAAGSEWPLSRRVRSLFSCLADLPRGLLNSSRVKPGEEDARLTKQR